MKLIVYKAESFMYHSLIMHYLFQMYRSKKLDDKGQGKLETPQRANLQ